MVASQIHLVRHGEVENPGGILYGRLPNYGLSDLGHEMARLAAADLVARRRGVTALYVSPLQRAQQSAQPISQAFELPVITDPRVIEPTNRFEGLVLDGPNSVTKNPKYWPWLVNPLRPSWGEAYASVRIRMLAAMTDAYNSVDDGDVVIVSHQLPIWTTHLTLAGKPMFHNPRHRRCSLSSITTFARIGNAFEEIGYSDPALAVAARAKDVGAV